MINYCNKLLQLFNTIKISVILKQFTTLIMTLNIYRDLTYDIIKAINSFNIAYEFTINRHCWKINGIIRIISLCNIAYEFTINRYYWKIINVIKIINLCNITHEFTINHFYWKINVIIKIVNLCKIACEFTIDRRYWKISNIIKKNWFYQNIVIKTQLLSKKNWNSNILNQIVSQYNKLN